MKAENSLAWKAALALVLLQPLVIDRPQAQQNDMPTLRTTTSEVLLDFVVRDKHAQVIRDLRPDEIQVYEDGVRQNVRHFEFFDGRVQRPAPESAPAAPATSSAQSPAGNAPAAQMTVNELRDISVVSVVIANLDPRERAMTSDAMREFVQNELKPNVYVGVFSLDMGGLRERQSYTNDGARITAAVAQATRSVQSQQLMAVNSAFTSDSGIQTADSAGTPAGADPGGGPVGGVGAEIDAVMDTSQVQQMQNAYLSSQLSLSPLHDLVEAQGTIPGRKVVLLFMAGLPVTQETTELLNSVISTANRANVTIYALSPNLGRGSLNPGRQMLATAANASRQQQLAKVSGGNMAVTPNEATSMDIAVNSIHANQVGNMAELAEGTGGALLPPTLDMREPLQRAMEDVSTHYELTYAPFNSSMDGKFRKIEVKVSRSGAKVFARDGYYALPMIHGQQIYPFELATMKAINTRPDLHHFDFKTTTLEFRPGAARNQFSFVFQAPTRDLTIKNEDHLEKVHVCITALVKDSKGEIVDKISKDIPYDVPDTQKDEMQQGLVSFTSPMELPPGHYTLDTAAVDRNSMKASVSRSELDVEQDSGFSMSDVTLARRVDEIDGTPNAFDALQAHGGQVTPDLSDVVVPDASFNLKFYAVAYPPAPVNAPVNVSIELRLNGKLVMKSPASPVPLDASGAAAIMARLPAAKLPSGHYEADVQFEYKGERLMKKVEFTLAGAS